MQEMIALLAPALVALGFYNHLHRNKLPVRKLIFNYGLFVTTINLCCFLVIIYLMGHDSVGLTDKAFIKYIILASALAFVLPFVVNLVENTVAVEVKKNDSEN